MRRQTVIRKLRIALAAVVAVVAMVPAMTAGANGVLRLDFEKEVVDTGVWVGLVEGEGRIETHLADMYQTGSVAHLRFDEWLVGHADAAFTAEVAGVLNLKTGKVKMSGVIYAGDLVGSIITVDAILDLTDFSSEGTMTITP